MILRPLLRTVLSPVLSPVFRYAGGSVSRNFTSFDSTSGAYIDVSSLGQLTGAFELELQTTARLGTHYGLISDSGTGDVSRISINSSGNLIAKFDGSVTNLGSVAADFDNDKLKTMVFKKSAGNACSFRIDNGTEVTGTNTRQPTFGRLFIDAFSGQDAVNANFKLWTGGDRNTGTLVIDMSVDGVYSENNKVVINKSSKLQDNVIPVFTAPSALEGGITVDFSDNQLSLTGLGTTNYPRAVFSNIVKTGEKYLVTATVDSTNTTNRSFLILGLDSSERLKFEFNDLGKVVTKTTILEAQTEDVRFYIDERADVMDLDNPVIFRDVSIQEVPSATPYGTAVNVIEADTEMFTFDSADNEWVGNNGTVIQV